MGEDVIDRIEKRRKEMINFDLQNHRPLREIVYEELKREILVGEIAPGTRMMEIELADIMGVSRTPVREAIRKLEKEGLVTIEPRKGAYASDVSIKDMVDVLEVREDLEAMAAALAAQKATKEERQNLINATLAYKEAVESQKAEDITKCDEYFHQLIVNCSGNKTLIQLFSQVQELALRFRYLYYDDFSRYKNMPMEHIEIEDAILSGDSQRARIAAGAHVMKLKQFVIDEGEKIFKRTQNK